MYGFDALVIFIILVAMGVWYPDHRSLDEGEELTGAAAAARQAGGGGAAKLKKWFGSNSGASANMRMEGLSHRP